MADECLLDITIGESTSIDVTVATASGVDVTVADSTAIAVTVATATGITSTVGSDSPVVITVSDDAIVIVVGQAIGVDVEVLEFPDLEEIIQTFEEFAARPRSVVRKLAANTASIAIHTTAPANVELPTGLVVYPTFRDSGYIELTCGGAHANVGPNTISFYLYGGPYGSTALLATFTTAALAVGVGNFQIEFRMTLKSQGPSSQNYAARIVYNEPGGGAVQTLDFIGRLTSLDFGNAANGDGGDVELRLESSVSGVGTTFNVRNMTIMQFAERSGT